MKLGRSTAEIITYHAPYYIERTLHDIEEDAQSVVRNCEKCQPINPASNMHDVGECHVKSIE